jgi:nicotinamide mononucleotide (NMN) deamidase PncC
LDLSRDAVAPSLPTAPKLDVGRIRGLLVKANESASTIRSRIVSGSATEEVRELAGLSISMLDLDSAVVEEGILPMASSSAASFATAVGATVSGIPPPSRPRVEPGTAELRAALASADKTTIVFDADLGAAPALA